jgi:D-alanyl-D-alanine carboxypeptidase
MTRRRTAASALIATVIMTGCTTADPAPSGSSNTTVSAAARLEEFAGRAVDDGALAIVLHVRDGEEEAAKAFGVRDLVSKTPAEVTDKLWISGAGTSMLAVSVMKLVEDERLGLDEPVADFLPEFSTIFPRWRRTTVRELLGSRTGLPDYIPPLLGSMPPEKLRTTALSFEERLRIAASTEAAPKPVLQATWSATDWEVLAWLVERLRGKPLAEVLRVDVFEPAGMTGSLLPGPGQPPEPMLHAYVLSGDKQMDFTRIDATAGSGDAGVLSSVMDVGKFLTALTTGRLVRPETWQQMTGAGSYDLGVQITEDICPNTAHVLASGGGGPYAILAAITADGQQQVSVAMVLPPAALDPINIPALVVQMEEGLRAAAGALCS